MISSLPEGPLREYWDVVTDDIDATAEEYRENGWETVVLHPGDFGYLHGEEVDRFGIDVVVPESEAQRVAEAVTAEGGSFDSSSVYQAAVENHVFLAVVVEDAREGTAVLFPTFYSLGDERVEPMFEAARERGEMHTHVRDLESEYLLTFTHDDLALFLPDDGPDPVDGT